MKAHRIAVAASAAAVCTLSLIAVAAPPNVKTITLDCAKGWRAGAGGAYGGVAFDVTCRNGKGSVRLADPVGTAYSIRVGVESASTGADCAYSGDAATVDETCVAVRLTVR